MFSTSLCILVLAPGLAPADAASLSFTVSAGKVARVNDPVCVPFSWDDKSGANPAVEVVDEKGTVIGPGQLTLAGLATQATGKATHELHFILPALEAGKSLRLTARWKPGVNRTAGKSDFRWKSAEKASTELLHGNRPVLRYEHPTLDESNAKAREATFKVFHQVYDPTGTALITKGVGGQYTHHRGLFYGFMKTTYGKTTVDIWHCKGQTHQAHREVLQSVAGPVLGRHRVLIDWNGAEKKTFAKEQRELTVYAVPGGTLIDFASLLTPTEGEIKLDGDPQHAGFHFRASNEVSAKTKGQTIFLRPDGVGQPGKEVNWPGKKDHVNLPWLGMSFVVGGKRYTACYLDRPDNPKEARFSERTYGRFGSYFVTTATKEKPLLVRYRVWVQEGQMQPEAIRALDEAFVHPVEVKDLVGIR